jgi:hypothetical protein
MTATHANRKQWVFNVFWLVISSAFCLQRKVLAPRCDKWWVWSSLSFILHLSFSFLLTSF